MLGTYDTIVQSLTNSGNLTATAALILYPDPIAFLDSPVRSCFTRQLKLWLRMHLAARQVRMALFGMEELKRTRTCRKN